MDEKKERRVYGPYVPKLRYDDEIDYKLTKPIAGRCYKSERLIIQRAEEAYGSKVKRRRRVIRTRNLLYQLLFENDLTVEIAFLDVGIKGYYVRYSKVKKLKWRNKKLGGRPKD